LRSLVARSTAIHAALGHCLWGAGRLDEAVEVMRASVELNPDAAITRAVIATVLSDAGKHEEALELAKAEPEPGFQNMSESIALHALGRHEESDAALARLIDKHADDMGMQIALAYTMRGDFDGAFEWLDHARDSRDSGIAEIARMPTFRRLHGDPRWREFLDSIRWPKPAETPA
jgi:tetratricopeptide (TPR) repeat protein